MSKTSGFTLIEIIVSVTIIALIAAIGLPNLRRFNEEQFLRTNADRLAYTLRQAQSNAQNGVYPDSGTTCPTGQFLYWQVTITNNQYTLGWVCDLPTPAFSASTNLTLTVNLPSNLPLTGPTGCGATRRVNFYRYNAYFSCGADASGNFILTMTNSAIARSRTITTGPGGSISVN